MRPLQKIFRVFFASLFAAIFLASPLPLHAARLGSAPAEEVPIDAINSPTNPLVWDSMIKKFTAKPDQAPATNQFVFTVTNTSKAEIIIKKVEPSCGCTVAKLPREPWNLKPGESGPLLATVDFSGKFGKLTKTMAVDSTAGLQRLTMELDVPVTEESKKREKNMEISRNDKQAVFKNDCASCHLKPALEQITSPTMNAKSCENLYRTACGVCHEAKNRASMVPALNAVNKKTYVKYWRYWLENGGPFLMPAFSKAKGGFLTDEQMDAMAEFLDKKFPSPTVIVPVSAK